MSDKLTISAAYYTGTDADGQSNLDTAAAGLIDGGVGSYINLGPGRTAASIGADLGSTQWVSRLETSSDADAWAGFRIFYNSANNASGWTEVTNLTNDKHNVGGEGVGGKYLNQWNFDVVGARWWKIWGSCGTGVQSVRELEIFSGEVPITFVFTDPLPAYLSTVYGNSQTLQLTVTVDGAGIYNATFYDATTSGIIGSTVSGTSSGQPVSTNWSTIDGGDYSWYLIAYISGSEDISSTYEFTKKYKCEGYVEIDSVRASGVPVRLYKRDTGELIGSTTSAGISGTFGIDTIYNENHYAVAIHPTDSGTNALIYDYLKPGE